MGVPVGPAGYTIKQDDFDGLVLLAPGGQVCLMLQGGAPPYLARAIAGACRLPVGTARRALLRLGVAA